MSNCTLTSESTIQDHSRSAAVAYAAAALRQDVRRKPGLPCSSAGGNRPGRIELRMVPGEFDTHAVEVRADGVIITGSDELGLVHGIHAFSECGIADRGNTGTEKTHG
jgi:hypothetical protein